MPGRPGRCNVKVMAFSADGLVSRAAREISLRADQLIHDVERLLRREALTQWEDPDLDAVQAEYLATFVRAILTSLEQGVEPSLIGWPATDVEGARQLARRGIPVSVLLRAIRLGQVVVLDQLLPAMARLTTDAQLVGRAGQKAIALVSGYADRMSELRVAAFQEERDRRLQWRLSTVIEAGKRIGTTLNIDRTAQELADFATQHFADLVTVDLLDSELRGQDAPAEDAAVLRRAAQRSAESGHLESKIRFQELHTFPDGSPPDRALTTGQPSKHKLGAGSAVPPEFLRAGESSLIGSMLAVPLRARNRTLGVTQFFRCLNSDHFDDEDLLLAQEIADRAAVAVDNARRYTHARTAALTLQRSLLPQLTQQQTAVEVAYRYLPASAQAGVGGDWYDVIPLSGARVAFVVGDVVGRGIHAAATMGRLRTAVRTLADIDLPPDELLTHLDDVVLRLSAEAATQSGTENAGDIGATCLYAVYDPISRRCTLARAGHVLPTVVTRDAGAELLELPPGPPLGLGGLPFESAEIDLPEGSLLVLYTDGLIESRDQDIETNVALLRQALARPDRGLEGICDTLLETLLPPRPTDDVALLVARTHAFGAQQVASWNVDSDLAAVSRARTDATEQLSSWGLEELDFTVELVVSELVTNAIRYGKPPVQLRLILPRPLAESGSASASTLLCEVSDASSSTPHLRRARTFDEGGRGLLLVAQVSEQWGTRHARQGKTVWAQLSTSAGVPAWDSTDSANATT